MYDFLSVSNENFKHNIINYGSFVTRYARDYIYNIDTLCNHVTTYFAKIQWHSWMQGKWKDTGTPPTLMTLI